MIGSAGTLGRGLRIAAAAAGGLALAVAAISVGQARELPATTSQVAPSQATADIVDTAVAAGDFTTLVAAVEAAGLVDTLKGAGPFTVFAPTDAAFAALPAGTVDALLANPDALEQVLLYHVVSGEVLAADVVGLTSATTVQGGDIAIAVDGGTVTLNGSSTVVATDVAASNGVIHVIDAVLLPPGVELPTPAAAATAVPNPPQSGTGGYLGTDEGISSWLLAGAAIALLATSAGAARFAFTRRSR